MAYYFVPSDFGLLTQFMALISSIAMFSNAIFGAGLIQSLSKHPVYTKLGQNIASNCIFLSGAIFFLIAILVIVFRNLIASELLDGRFEQEITLFVILLFISNLGNYYLSYNCSIGNLKFFTNVNNAGQILYSALLICSIIYFGIHGASYAVASGTVITCFISLLYLIIKRDYACLFVPRFDLGLTKDLLFFSLVTFAGALSLPMSQILIRQDLGDYSWDTVGIWQSSVKISDVYMQFVGALFIYYALPIITNYDLVHSMKFMSVLTLKIVFLFTLGFVVMWPFKENLIILLFSDAYIGLKDYLFPQFVGDVFRIIGSAFSYILISRGKKFIPLLYELMQGVFVYIFFNIFFKLAPQMSPVYAHITSYLILATTMLLCTLALKYKKTV